MFETRFTGAGNGCKSEFQLVLSIFQLVSLTSCQIGFNPRFFCFLIQPVS